MGVEGHGHSEKGAELDSRVLDQHPSAIRHSSLSRPSRRRPSATSYPSTTPSYLVRRDGRFGALHASNPSAPCATATACGTPLSSSQGIKCVDRVGPDLVSFLIYEPRRGRCRLPCRAESVVRSQPRCPPPTVPTPYIQDDAANVPDTQRSGSPTAKASSAHPKPIRQTDRGHRFDS